MRGRYPSYRRKRQCQRQTAGSAKWAKWAKWPKPKENCGNNGQGKGQGQGQCNKPTHNDRQAAAARALQQGALNPLMVDALAAPLIDGAPHYFSHPNYANSPLPAIEGAVIDVGNPLIERAYATDFAAGIPVGELAPVFVVVPTALPDGLLQSFQTWNQANQGTSPFPSAGNVFHAYVLRPTTGSDYTVVFDSGLLTVPALADSAVSEIATFGVANLAVQAGDVLAFYGQGIPVDTGSGSDIFSFPARRPHRCRIRRSPSAAPSSRFTRRRVRTPLEHRW